MNISFVMSLSNIRRLLTVLLLFVTSLGALAQSEIIRVTGKVVDSKKGEPLGFVNVTDMETKRLVAQTNVDGRFSVNVHANTTLRFSMIGAEVMSVKLRGRDSLMVQMIMTDVALGTVETVAKRVVNRVIVEPTPMEIVGNTVYFKNVVGVPSKMFGHNRRLVAQRVFKNKTRKQTVIMRPLVYDAVEYNQTQDRLYSFDMKGKDGDPLAPFVLIKNDT